MKKAVNLDSLYLELPFMDRFAAAAADGFRYVEMWYHHDRNIEQIRQALQQHNLKMSGMNDILHSAILLTRRSILPKSLPPCRPQNRWDCPA